MSSSKPLIECVPNISEGRNRKVIEQVVDRLSKVAGVSVLHVDSGTDTNRTVITFAGEAAAILSGAYEMISQSIELIDMSKHQGAHPRLGAVDVCPFIPLQAADMAECVHLARELGSKVAQNFSIPVYIYGKAALRPERENFKNIRDGQYEGLQAKLARPEWKPDFGPAQFNARSGAITIGARPILIAYNVNLSGTDVATAKLIAKLIRRDKLLPRTQSLGWYLESFQKPQVSFNLLDFQVTGLYEVFQTVTELAKLNDLTVTGSELVGLVPKGALLDCGAKAMPQLRSEEELIDAAIAYLGLNDIRHFDPSRKVLELRIGNSSSNGWNWSEEAN